MEEQEEVQGATEQNEAAQAETVETAEPAERQEPAKSSDGKEFLDFSELPPELAGKYEARFKRLYGHVKQSNRALDEMGKATRAVIDRLEKLESGDFDKQMTGLQDRQREAFESGDFDKAQKLTDELLDYKIAAKERGKAPIKIPEVQSGDGPLNEEHLNSLGFWASETDGSGAPKRPWANPKHPQYTRAFQLIQAAAMDPDIVVMDESGEITEKSFQSILRAVDDRMNGKSDAPRSRTAAVLSGNGDARPRESSKTAKLSPDEIRVAEGLGYTPKQYAEIKQKYGVK